jgi:general stress protein YciG
MVVMLTSSHSQREIASMGGQASSGKFEPGSEKAREAGRKGGLASGGGNSGDDDE